MLSNTKLSVYEKTSRKTLLAALVRVGGFVFSFPEFSVTVAIVPKFDGANFSDVAIAIASPDEKKFRWKVGEYHTLNRQVNGECMTVPTPNDAYAFALNLAKLVAGVDVAPTVNKNEFHYDFVGNDSHENGFVYDSNGFDCDGFDYDGYDENDFDKNGFDRDGFDSAGFGCDGFDYDGYDENGFDENGFDRDGFDRDGFDSVGLNSAGCYRVC